MKKKWSKLLAILLAGIFVMNSSIAYLSAKAEETTQEKVFTELNPILYKKNDTLQSNTGYSVSFQINDKEGIGHIPCKGLSHEKKYTPIESVSGSSLYKNGQKEDGMYLAAYNPNSSDNKYMQFVISWENTSTPTIANGDIIRIQGSFEHTADDGTHYVLQFNRTEFRWTGDDWEQLQITTYSNLVPTVYSQTDTGWTAPSEAKLSFNLSKDGIGSIPLTQYQPVDGGCYRNGVQDEGMTLHALSNNSNANTMQFYMIWSELKAGQVGDYYGIDGTFECRQGSSVYVLQFNKTEFLYYENNANGKAMLKNISEKRFDNLKSNLYPVGATGQLTNQTFSFWVPEQTGLNAIPCASATHSITYEPINEGGIYRNGKLDQSLYLGAFSWDGGKPGMQFVVSCENTYGTSFSKGDVVRLTGDFARLDVASGVRYVLNFTAYEVIWNGSAWAEHITPEILGYERITLADFGMRNGTYTNAHTSGTYSGESLNMKYLDVDLRFTGDNDSSINTSIRYGGSDGWSGIKIGARSGQMIYIYDAYSPAIGYSLSDLGISDYSQTFNLKFATKIDGADVTYSFWINDILIDSGKKVSSMTNSGNMLGLAVNTENVNDSISIGTAKRVMNSDVSYDLTDGSYLLTGSDIKVNGDTKNAGDTLNTAGTYTIERTSDFVTTTQKVTLYRFGDVNMDGTVTDQDDVTALESLLTEKGIHAVSTAADYAADINQDGRVSKKDLTLMTEIVAGTKQLKDVKIPALTYDYLGGDTVMPIAGFNGPYNDSENQFLNDKTWQLVKECGINMIASSENYMGANIDNAEKYALDAIEQAEKYGIGYLMRDDKMIAGVNNLTTNTTGADLNTYLNRYDYFDNFLGVHVKDEPTTDNLDEYTKVGTALNTYTNQISWINALPSLTFDDKAEYQTYIKNIVTKTNARVIPFDDYPFDREQEVGNTLSNTVKKYFISLDAVRSVAEEKGIPFWGTVAAGGDWRNDGDSSATNNKKIATEAETYWNVNTLLAFGAKGITWFPLVQPKKFANASDGQYDYDRNGLISADPNHNENGTTSHYAWAKAINLHIAQVDEVLMKAKNKGIMVTGTTTKSIMNVADVTTLDSTERLKKVESSGTLLGTIVGCFDYRDAEAYYVVNYDVSENQKITLTLDDDYYVRLMQQGKAEELKPTTNKKIELTLAPGQAALVVLQSETEMFCKTSSGVSLDDLEADKDSTATVLKAVGGEQIGTATVTAPFKNWGNYTATYFVDGKLYARKLTMYTLGDITYDGNTNCKDLVRMKKAVGNQLTAQLTKAQKLSGDIDENDNIEQSDLLQLRKILVGK